MVKGQSTKTIGNGIGEFMGVQEIYTSIVLIGLYTLSMKDKFSIKSACNIVISMYIKVIFTNFRHFYV